MSPESMTNVLLITLITLLGFIGTIGIKKINELIADVRALLLSDLNNKKDIISLQESSHDHEIRIKGLENNNHKIQY